MSSSQQLFSNITSAGQLEFSLVDVAMPAPKSHGAAVKMEAAPIKPSDMWPLFGTVNLRSATLPDDEKILTAPVHSGNLLRMKFRLNIALQAGNEEQVRVEPNFSENRFDPFFLYSKVTSN